ncbi:PREDICTED: smad nuclear-interacting protein 1-like [Galeopterus variegatus]|uniref:Smad nuclear-interacting protein 1-like n=1 Tax=Galeopterus variegatus TaxID=482537 RepID=A0ABM0QMV5_GALVR|nr:PREDICTED: smad nuclear-interacting protein 1-like [Galeopterus variegatus]
MKDGKSQRDRESRQRHCLGDLVTVAAMVVEKQEHLSPQAEWPALRHPDVPRGGRSLPTDKPGRPGHHRVRARVVSRSPVKKKSKSSGRGKSPGSRRSRSPHHSAVTVKQEREDHPRRGRWDGQHREPAEQEHRRARDSDPDRRHGHSHRRTASKKRPGRGQVQDRDMQTPQAQEEEREWCHATRQEHCQKKEARGTRDDSPEVSPPPGGNNKEKEVPTEEKPRSELSGALLEDTNTFRGVVIKYSEPPEARIPKRRWRLYPFKHDEVLPVLCVHRQSAYLLGRHRRVADIPLDHPSCSKQHAVFQCRLVHYTRADGTAGWGVKPYIIDLGSGNGTFLNNKRIEPQRYYELKEKDVLRFGFSSREYVLLHESSDTSEVDRKEEDVCEEQ